MTILVERAIAPTLEPAVSAAAGLELPATLAAADVAAHSSAREPVALSRAAAESMRRSRAGLEAMLDAGEPIYGSTTGFGPHVRFAAAEDPYAHGAGLIAHLAAGAGDLVEPRIVRATMLVRANALAQGRSGANPMVVTALLELLASDVVPAVPAIGSVGASGDLIPLAHIARVLTGEGTALAQGNGAHRTGSVRPAAQALAGAGLQPLRLDGRDALALVNGTSYSTALAALAADRTVLLLTRAAELTGWLYAGLGARRQALDNRLHAVRGQRGQQRAAAVIRAIAGMTPENDDRGLQEVYSLRCAPQVIGAAMDIAGYATGVVEDELAGVNDNPVLVEDPSTATGWAALHGGNFHAAASATAADSLNGALTQVGVLAERQIDVLSNPATSFGPLLLASRPGAQAGLAGAQLTASAMVAEMRHGCAWASTMSIPTNAGNQDVVPMAPLAARTAWAQTERLAVVLAILAVAIGQQQHLVARGLAAGFASPPPAWLPATEGFDTDVETHSRIEAARALVLRPPSGVPTS